MIAARTWIIRIVREARRVADLHERIPSKARLRGTHLQLALSIMLISDVEHDKCSRDWVKLDIDGALVIYVCGPNHCPVCRIRRDSHVDLLAGRIAACIVGPPADQAVVGM